MSLWLILLLRLFLLVHHLLLLCISQYHLLLHLPIIPMDHLCNHSIRKSCFSRWYHLILIITPIIIIHFFNLFFLILILMWNDLLLFLSFLNLWCLFLLLFLNSSTTLRLSNWNNNRTCTAFLFWLHFKLLLLLFFIWIIKWRIRIIYLFKLSPLICMLLLESRWFYIQLLLEICVLLRLIFCTFNVILFYLLDLLLKYILSVLNNVYLIVLLFALLVLLHACSRRLLFGMCILNHLIENSGSSFFLVIVGGVRRHNLSVIRAHGVLVAGRVLYYITFSVSAFHVRWFFLFKVLLWHWYPDFSIIKFKIYFFIFNNIITNF